jgi:hypothetical protein
MKHTLAILSALALASSASACPGARGFSFQGGGYVGTGFSRTYTVQVLPPQVQVFSADDVSNYSSGCPNCDGYGGYSVPQNYDTVGYSGDDNGYQPIGYGGGGFGGGFGNLRYNGFPGQFSSGRCGFNFSRSRSFGWGGGGWGGGFSSGGFSSGGRFGFSGGGFSGGSRFRGSIRIRGRFR